jgi:hypothetical protein
LQLALNHVLRTKELNKSCDWFSLTEEIENFIERDRKIKLIDLYLERAMICEKLNTNGSKELALKDMKKSKN